MEHVDYREILKTIAEAARKTETVDIYYPETENTPAGWREVEPYSLTTDVGEEGEHLIYEKDRLSPGHIFNAYVIGNEKRHCHSFIIGKIKKVKLTGFGFTPKWPVEFL